MQRKVFRIEQTLAGRRVPATPNNTASDLADEVTMLRQQLQRQSQESSATFVQALKAELAQIRDGIAQNKRALGNLIDDGNERHMARAAAELSAAVNGMENGTDKILKAAEIIDESARALTASLQDEYKRGLAQEIQDQVIDVFEACNFQDISGQRIGKVIATLAEIEKQIEAALAYCDTTAPAPAATARLPGNGLLNGPKLSGDRGHASQHDIDKMFGT